MGRDWCTVRVNSTRAYAASNIAPASSRMTPVVLVEPGSLREAAAALGDGPSHLPVAGGTAVMLMMKTGLLRPARLVSLRSIERRYSEIALDADGGLRIGAMTTLTA